MTRAGAIFAHPGHELLVLSWARRSRARIAVVTDGSGSAGPSRHDFSRCLLRACGASLSPVFGRHPDRVCYDFLRARDTAPFIELRDEIARDFEAAGVTTVLSDDLEFYNPVHDLACVIADAVAGILQNRSGSPVTRYRLPIEPLGGARRLPKGSADLIRVEQSEADLRFKRRALNFYEPISGEAARMRDRGELAEFLEEAYRRTPIRLATETPRFEPHYEAWGRERVAQGVYDDLITYERHVRPVANAILRDVQASASSPATKRSSSATAPA